MMEKMSKKETKTYEIHINKSPRKKEASTEDTTSNSTSTKSSTLKKKD